MSLKLKGIKIDSFRAFERQKYFDCVNPVFNEISNLIVLYAPNGTGKTSFFDAIEWSLTGEISRLNENKNVRDIASQERKYILKNKYSSAEVGSVELAFDDGSFYALTTKKLNGKQTTDYVEGNETKKTVDLTAKELKILRQKNLLTHNQIDAFLRSQSAEGRYDALSNFWDKENVSEDYKNLVLFVNEMNKALGQQETKMNQLTKEIEKLESNAKIWQTINQLKENYAKLNGKNSKKDPLLNNQLGLQELYIESNKLKSNNQIKLNQFEEERQQLENLITMTQEYRQIPQQIEWSEKQVADVNEKLAHLTEIETIEEKKKALFDEKIDLSNHLKRCNFLINHEADFQAQEMAEQNSNREINEWINQRKKCEQALITLQKEHQEQEVTLSECQNKRALRTNQLTEIKELNSYSDVKAKRQLLDHETKQQKKKKIELEAKLGKIKLTLTKLFSLLNLDDHQLSQKDYSKDPDYSFLLEQTSQLDDIWQERKKLEVDLAQKKKERSSLEDLGSQLEQLKKLGYSIVTDTSSSVCPLCLHDHQEFQHIIQKIEASTADLLPIEQLTKESSHLEGMIDDSTGRLTDVVSGVKQQIQIQITIKETEINQLDQDLLQVTLKLKQQEEAYLTNEKHWHKLNEYSQKYGIDCEKIAEETQKRVKSLQEELVKLTNEYQNIKEKINQNEQLNVKNTHTLKTIELHYQQAKKSLNDLKGNEQYQYYQQEQAFYEALGISVISDFKRQCKRELEKINEQETKLIAEKEQRLEQVNGKSKTELVEEQRIQSEQIRQLVVRRKYIEKISYQLFDQVIIAPEELEKNKQKLTTAIYELTEKNQLLSQLSGLTSDFISETGIEEKRSEQAKVKKIYDHLSRKVQELKELKDSKLTEIKKQIKSTFNLDTVNQIFQMIEPHPDFRKISFKINEANPDKLGLDIMCKRTEDEEDAPILYLSSAQVNILSLSIFLGTALENTDKVNTIFMDDPIQHLDSLNELSFIDLLRILAFKLGTQIIFSTHNRQFFDLCQRKLDANYHNASFIEMNYTENQL
ncbi:AAA family ATPase [Enterococcus hirae]|uniref:AAA family ATPase n=1 Tax=Enterococcus sp. C63 TaxID=3231324 RepID=UPI001A05B501|nr:AAA family ATPase [Enterococcus hirae]EMF0448868.1 AAA family ATPase [Enterococcus hirae]EMF0516935.1 AAA family ATPase [Enterococcus hirae]